MIGVGTAGWTIPRAHAALFPGDGPHLVRYAARLGIAEINTSFYRPHRASTYARWAASVPDGFRFSVKLPRTITHDARLIDTETLLQRFAVDIRALGDRLGPVLVQLPPKLAFIPEIAARFFTAARAALAGTIVCEPRHPTWFEQPASTLLAQHNIARVAADPACVPAAARPGGWSQFAYLRLHGSPDIYRSDYGPERLREWREVIDAVSANESWCIFDNTTLGAAAMDAVTLANMLAPAIPLSSPSR